MIIIIKLNIPNIINIIVILTSRSCRAPGCRKIPATYIYISIIHVYVYIYIYICIYIYIYIHIHIYMYMHTYILHFCGLFVCLFVYDCRAPGCCFRLYRFVQSSVSHCVCIRTLIVLYSFSLAFSFIVLYRFVQFYSLQFFVQFYSFIVFLFFKKQFYRCLIVYINLIVSFSLIMARSRSCRTPGCLHFRISKQHT